MIFMYYGIKVKYVYYIYLMWLENFILYGGNGVVVIFNLFLFLFYNFYYFRGWGLEFLGRMVIL